MNSPALWLNRKALAFAAASLVACASQVYAQESSGFFSGLRFGPVNGVAPGALSFAPQGLKLGQALEFSRPADPANPVPNATTAFGGYQFGSGVTLGAALNATNSTSPFGANAGSTERDGVGLRFDASRWTVPAQTSTVNVDVVSAFNYRNFLSVYGKIGVARTDLRPGEMSYVPGLPERTSLLYGVGVRYDFSPNVGLKFELSRGTKFGLGNTLKTHDEPDSLNLGLRWSF